MAKLSAQLIENTNDYLNISYVIEISKFNAVIASIQCEDEIMARDRFYFLKYALTGSYPTKSDTSFEIDV